MKLLFPTLLYSFLVFSLPTPSISDECSSENITGSWKDGQISWNIKKNGSIETNCTYCYCGDGKTIVIPARRSDVKKTTCREFEGKPRTWKLTESNEIVIFFTKGFTIKSCNYTPGKNTIQIGEIKLVPRNK